MLEAYARERHWSVYDFYIDEDFSGSDRERPAFNRLITDSLLGRFGIVLCKKQARFARDIEYVEKYVHGLFSERQIRFVAVLDNIDTGSVSRSARKASQINSLVDEWYLSDLSESIIAALDIKRKNGEFIGSWAPYGYRKDPGNKSRLIVDPDQAQIVRKIFDQYCGGIGIRRIAARLNASNTPNPLLAKKLQGEKIDPSPSRKTINRYLWTPSTISAILHNRTYCGDLVQGKFRKANYKSKKLLRIAERDWIIIPGCHERIIDEETWSVVQKQLSSKRRFSCETPARPLNQLASCAECGARLISSGGRSGNRKVSYLCCSRHRLAKDACQGARIEAQRLENIVLKQFRDICTRYSEEAPIQAAAEILSAYYLQTTSESGHIITRLLAGLFIESVSVSRRKADGTQEVIISWSF